VRLDLVDLLRCPAGHEETWLVLTAERWDERRVLRGRLGCPVCRAEYPVVNGVVDFTAGAGAATEPSPGGDASTPDRDDARIVRLAAQLDLREPGGTVLLAGSYAGLADGLTGLTESNCVVLGPVSPSDAVTALRVGTRLPLATGSIRAAAIDDLGGPVAPAEVARVLRPGARVVGRVGQPLPGGVVEVARDTKEWVAAVLPTGPEIVGLVRRRKAGDG